MFVALCNIDLRSRCNIVCVALGYLKKMLRSNKVMSTDPVVLLKRSDGPYYRVHIGQGYEAVAELLSRQQAFIVSPILICPCPSLNAVDSIKETIQSLCIPLYNNWFQAPSNDIASIVLLRSMTPSPDSSSLEDDNKQEESINCTESANHMDDEQEEATQCIESCSTEDLDARLWAYVAPCGAKDASKAADIRTNLIQRLGKTDAKRILSHCVTTVAKDSHGQKNRVLKVHGKMLKLIPSKDC